MVTVAVVDLSEAGENTTVLETAQILLGNKYTSIRKFSTSEDAVELGNDPVWPQLASVRTTNKEEAPAIIVEAALRTPPTTTDDTTNTHHNHCL